MLEPESPEGVLTILVVEDNADTRALMKALLEGMGHEVTVAPTMGKGLAALTDRRFDVLISDIGLPDGSGWELLEKAPADSTSMAIAMSGFGQRDDREKSEAAGFQHHLLKPFDPDELMGLLEAFAGAR